MTIYTQAQHISSWDQLHMLYYKPAYTYLHMTSAPQGLKEQNTINFKNSAGRNHVWNQKVTEYRCQSKETMWSTFI